MVKEVAEIVAMVSKMHIEMVTELHMAIVSKLNDWWYDSGGTVHIYNNKSYFKESVFMPQNQQ